jgi:hypothetical protein
MVETFALSGGSATVLRSTPDLATATAALPDGA